MRLSHRHFDKHFALQRLIWCLTMLFKRRVVAHRETWPAVGYCECCGMWTWRTSEATAYSTHVARLCQECAEIERRDVSAAWSEYYSGLL